MSAGPTRLIPAPRRRAEPVIGLINVVFLMLVFFLLAGTIAPRPEAGLDLVQLDTPPAPAPADTLVLTAEGVLRHQGAPADIPTYLASLPQPPVARLMPDRAAPAAALVAAAGALSRGGAVRVVILGARPAGGGLE